MKGTRVDGEQKTKGERGEGAIDGGGVNNCGNGTKVGGGQEGMGN